MGRMNDRTRIDHLLAYTPKRVEIEARAREKRGAHTGAAAAIRESLGRGKGWQYGLNREELAESTGLSVEKVKNSLCLMAGQLGELVSFGKKGARRYALRNSPAAHAVTAPKARPSGEFAIAAKVVIGRGLQWKDEF